MIEPIQGTELRPAPQSEAAGVWTDSVRRSTGTAPLPGRHPKEDVQPVGRDQASAEVMRNLSLRFRIDPDTHDITVLIVDPATRRVVRSVPPEELHKMSHGELVELRI